MMRYYAPEIARKYIENNKANIKSVDMGMKEDWFSTAVTVFEDGEYYVDLTGKTVCLAGIPASEWATPVMRVTFVDGTEKERSCWKYFKEVE